MYVVLNLPKDGASFKLTAVGSKTHWKLMGCQMPDSVQITLISVKLPNRKKESISQCKDIPIHTSCQRFFSLSLPSFFKEVRKTITFIICTAATMCLQKDRQKMMTLSVISIMLQKCGMYSSTRKCSTYVFRRPWNDRVCMSTWPSFAKTWNHSSIESEYWRPREADRK